MARFALGIGVLLSLAGCNHEIYLPPYHFTSAATNELETGHFADLSQTQRTMARSTLNDTTQHESFAA